MSSSPRAAPPSAITTQAQPSFLHNLSTSITPQTPPPPSLPVSSSPGTYYTGQLGNSPRYTSKPHPYFTPVLPLFPFDTEDKSETQELPVHHLPVFPNRDSSVDLAPSENTTLSSPSQYLATRGEPSFGPRIWVSRQRWTPQQSSLLRYRPLPLI
jgi:hypothetical protein